jgi:hypothetical protein
MGNDQGDVMAGSRKRRKPTSRGQSERSMLRRRRSRYTPAELFMAGVGVFVLVVVAVVLILAVFGGEH